MSHWPAGRVAYLTKRFPRLSETFILDEIIGLEHCGVPLSLYSIANPAEPLIQPKVSQVRSSVRYLHPHGGGHGLRRRVACWLTDAAEAADASARLLGRHPLRYLSTVSYIARKRRHLSTLKHFVEATKMAVATEDEGASHVHAAFAHGPASVAHFVSRLTGVPFSFSAHAKDLYLSPPNLLARKAAAASFVTVCSASAAEELRRVIAAHYDPAVNTQAHKVVLAPHGVDVEHFHPLPRAVQDPTAKTRILAVGRLVPKKGYPVLLEALEALCARGYDFDCHIVGAGPLRQEMEERIASGPLAGKVSLLGAMAQPGVLDQYRWADIFVQSSVVVKDGDRDGIPNSLVEAMACGLAVVGSDVAGIPEVIEDGRTGLVVRPGEAADLADALALLLGDATRRQQMGAAARAWTEEHFSRSECISVVAALFGYPGPSGKAPASPGPSAGEATPLQAIDSAAERDEEPEAVAAEGA